MPTAARFVLLEDEDPVENGILDQNHLPLTPYSPAIHFQGAENPGVLYPVGPSSAPIVDPTHALDLDLLATLNAPINDQTELSSWFDSLETWRVRYPQASECEMPISDLKRSISVIHRWLREWVENGSNPFIHPRLYRNKFPRCVQDAYTALTCYLYKTPANEQTIFKILESQSRELVAKYGSNPGDVSQENHIKNAAPLDTMEHIARVQALLVYQAIGLYDGDIGLRHVSETHIPVFTRWLKEMIDHASQEECLGTSIVGTSEGTTYPVQVGTHTEDQNMLWYSWVVAESMRRSWLVGSSIQVIFVALQGSKPVPCKGGMVFTTRSGVWEAKSAVAWEKLCSEKYVGLIQMADADRLFTETVPEEVDEFTKLVLEIIFGRERMERWELGCKIDGEAHSLGIP